MSYQDKRKMHKYMRKLWTLNNQQGGSSLNTMSGGVRRETIDARDTARALLRKVYYRQNDDHQSVLGREPYSDGRIGIVEIMGEIIDNLVQSTSKLASDELNALVMSVIGTLNPSLIDVLKHKMTFLKEMRGKVFLHHIIESPILEYQWYLLNDIYINTLPVGSEIRREPLVIPSPLEAYEEWAPLLVKQVEAPARKTPEVRAKLYVLFNQLKDHVQGRMRVGSDGSMTSSTSGEVMLIPLRTGSMRDDVIGENMAEEMADNYFRHLMMIHESRTVPGQESLYDEYIAKMNGVIERKLRDTIRYLMITFNERIESKTSGNWGDNLPESLKYYIQLGGNKTPLPAEWGDKIMRAAEDVQRELDGAQPAAARDGNAVSGKGKWQRGQTVQLPKATRFGSQEGINVAKVAVIAARGAYDVMNEILTQIRSDIMPREEVRKSLAKGIGSLFNDAKKLLENAPITYKVNGANVSTPISELLGFDGAAFTNIIKNINREKSELDKKIEKHDEETKDLIKKVEVKKLRSTREQRNREASDIYLEKIDLIMELFSPILKTDKGKSAATAGTESAAPAAMKGGYVDYPSFDTEMDPSDSVGYGMSGGHTNHVEYPSFDTEMDPSDHVDYPSFDTEGGF